ncbi:MAG: hypothetical protein ICV54_19625 [Nostoc sp. C3-bin3]|nr:hypothetical protein [Nostoc sp. C3-bin3]
MIAFNKSQRQTPASQHWEELARVSSLFMTPEEFLANWDVSAQELAQIAGTSVSTVNHWFTENARSPQPYHKFRLALIHRRWLRL